MHELARAYADGRGLSRDPERAAEWYLKAIASGAEFTLDQWRRNWRAYPIDSRIAMQKRLQVMGYTRITANGDFGPDTVAALDALPGQHAAVPRGSDPALRVAPGSGQSFRDKLANGADCAFCPEMVVVPAGSFLMGSPASEQGRYDNEGPQRTVTIRQAFAVGKFEVTFDEWAACVAGGGCTHRPNDHRWGRGKRPVIDVSWEDAKQYVAWLGKATGKGYRLLTEAEWEYAARATSKTRYSFGDSDGGLGQHAWYFSNSGSKTHPVGEKQANAWGLHDMHGNAWEWVEDCWIASYNGASEDERARTTGDCSRRVLRGGSWFVNPRVLRSASRSRGSTGDQGYDGGFRVGRTF